MLNELPADITLTCLLNQWLEKRCNNPIRIHNLWKCSCTSKNNTNEAFFCVCLNILHSVIIDRGEDVKNQAFWIKPQKRPISNVWRFRDFADKISNIWRFRILEDKTSKNVPLCQSEQDGKRKLWLPKAPSGSLLFLPTLILYNFFPLILHTFFVSVFKVSFLLPSNSSYQHLKCFFSFFALFFIQSVVIFSKSDQVKGFNVLRHWPSVHNYFHDFIHSII